MEVSAPSTSEIGIFRPDRGGPLYTHLPDEIYNTHIRVILPYFTTTEVLKMLGAEYSGSILRDSPGYDGMTFYVIPAVIAGIPGSGRSTGSSIVCFVCSQRRSL
jgi:hypothetical protein